jgi:hypothetical protein
LTVIINGISWPGGEVETRRSAKPQLRGFDSPPGLQKVWYITLVKRSKLLPLGIGFAIAGVLAGLLVIRLTGSTKPTAGLKVETDIPSLVFVNSVQLGETPFDRMLPPGDVTLRLVPQATSSAVTPYQTRIRLTDKVYTVIRRNFGPSDSASSGEIISLIPQSAQTASLSIVTSDPDSASVLIDNEPQGFTPLTIDSVTAADHQIEINAPGYETTYLNAKAVNGYKLTITAKLAVRNQATPVVPQALLTTTPPATPSATIKPTPAASGKQVKILDTPTGFLRVRATPSTGAKEVGRLTPGETYPLLNMRSGWFEIQGEFTATNSGWISDQYAQKQ